MKFNINGKVRVRLTERGRATARALHDAIVSSVLAQYPGLKDGIGLSYEPPKEDADGWSEWQMWELMRTFGLHCGAARPDMFDNEIDIPVTEVGPDHAAVEHVRAALDASDARIRKLKLLPVSDWAQGVRDAHLDALRQIGKAVNWINPEFRPGSKANH